METPTESDVTLLQLIVQLTDEGAGRPPTLAELAAGLGLKRSSAANIQRQLARLRPTYVDWTSSPRSIHLTSSGEGLISSSQDIAPATALPAKDIFLPLLASGLTRLAEDIRDGKPLRVPYPDAWQRGLNILAAECILQGQAPPQHTMAVLDWCRRPARTWGLRFSVDAGRMLEDPLFGDDQPTDFCRELAQTIRSTDVELELTEQMMLRVRNAAEARREPHAYVAVRQYLIEHPVVTDDTLYVATFDPAMRDFGSDVYDMYERVPASVVADGAILLCGHCGWTLEQRRGRLQCDSDRCRVLTANFTRNTGSFPITGDLSEILRARRAIRRYVIAPGTYELALAGRMRVLGATVELWPGYDAYDLRIIFPDGEVWAVDVKDWRYPRLLAPRLRAIPDAGSLRWDRAVYAIPDDRVLDTPNYLTLLQRATVRDNFTVLTISGLVEEAQARVGGQHASIH